MTKEEFFDLPMMKADAEAQRLMVAMITTPLDGSKEEIEARVMGLYTQWMEAHYQMVHHIASLVGEVEW